MVNNSLESVECVTSETVSILEGSSPIYPCGLALLVDSICGSWDVIHVHQFTVGLSGICHDTVWLQLGQWNGMVFSPTWHIFPISLLRKWTAELSALPVFRLWPILQSCPIPVLHPLVLSWQIQVPLTGPQSLIHSPILPIVELDDSGRFNL